MATVTVNKGMLCSGLCWSSLPASVSPALSTANVMCSARVSREDPE